MRSVRILDEASEEAAEAIVWYESEQVGLGLELWATIDSTLDLLNREPIPFVSIPGKERRADLKRLLMRRFPYAVIVLMRPTEYVVVAFAHFSKRPGYWRKRVPREAKRS